MTAPKQELLTPKQVAQRFGVTDRTITRWADQGKLHSIRTAGNHRRFFESDIDAIITDGWPINED